MTLKSAAWVQIDLLDFRDRPFDQSTVSQMLNLLSQRIQDEVSEATQQLHGRYDPDTWEHLRDIYNKEVRKFQKLKYPESTDQDAAYIAAVRDYVWQLRERDPHEHLIRIIHWLTVNCKLPVVIVLDNSDQLGIEFQEFLYKLSETFQKKTSAVTILVLRTEALYSLPVRVVQQIKSKAALAEYTASECLNEFAVAGCDRDLLARILNILRADKLISVPHMLPELREQDSLQATKLGDFIVNSAIRYELYYEQIVFDVVIYDYEAHAELRSIWNSDLEAYQKFHNMGYILMKLIQVDDTALRRELTLSLLEPTIGVPLPLPLAGSGNPVDLGKPDNSELPSLALEAPILPANSRREQMDDRPPQKEPGPAPAKRASPPPRDRQANRKLAKKRSPRRS
jgi:hypothetical protein